MPFSDILMWYVCMSIYWHAYTEQRTHSDQGCVIFYKRSQLRCWLRSTSSIAVCSLFLHAYNPGHHNYDYKLLIISSTLSIRYNKWQDGVNLSILCKTFNPLLVFSQMLSKLFLKKPMTVQRHVIRIIMDPKGPAQGRS